MNWLVPVLIQNLPIPRNILFQLKVSTDIQDRLNSLAGELTKKIFLVVMLQQPKMQQVLYLSL